jgi:hypothetical protein
MKWLSCSLFAICVAASTAGYAADEMLSVAPDQMKWGPVDVIPDAQAAVVSGDPSKTEPFVMEIRWDEGSKIGPHWHSSTERVIIVSGTGLRGMGDRIDLPKGDTMAAGSYTVLPAKMQHWFVAKTPVVMIVEGVGPFDVNFVHPEDDPRKKEATRQ